MNSNLATNRRTLNYLPVPKFEEGKINELFNLNMDIGEFKSFSLKNNVPLKIQNKNRNYNNLIHEVLTKKDLYLTEDRRLNLIKYFVNNGVSIDQPNQFNQTPLHFACKLQYYNIVKYFIEKGVNVNFKDSYGFSSIHYYLQGKISNHQDKSYVPLIRPRVKDSTNFSLEKIKKYTDELIGEINKNKTNVELSINKENIDLKDLDMIPDFTNIMQRESTSLDPNEIFNDIKNSAFAVERNIIDKLGKLTNFTNINNSKIEGDNISINDFELKDFNNILKKIDKDKKIIKAQYKNKLNYFKPLKGLNNPKSENILKQKNYVSSSQEKIIPTFVRNYTDDIFNKSEFEDYSKELKKDCYYIYKKLRRSGDFDKKLKEQLNFNFKIFKLSSGDDYLFEYKVYIYLLEGNDDELKRELKNLNPILESDYENIKICLTTIPGKLKIQYAFYFTLIRNCLVPSIWESFWNFINNLEDDLDELQKYDNSKIDIFKYGILNHYSNNLSYARAYNFNYLGMIKIRINKTSFMIKNKIQPDRSRLYKDDDDIIKHIRLSNLKKFIDVLNITDSNYSFFHIPLMIFISEKYLDIDENIESLIKNLNSLYAKEYTLKKYRGGGGVPKYLYYNGLLSKEYGNTNKIRIYSDELKEIKSDYLFFNQNQLPEKEFNCEIERNILLDNILPPILYLNYKEIIEKIVTDIIKDLVGIPGIKAEILKDDNDVSGTFKKTLNKNKRIQSLKILQKYVLDRIKFKIKKNIIDQINSKKLKDGISIPEIDNFIRDAELSLDVIDYTRYVNRDDKSLRYKFPMIKNISDKYDYDYDELDKDLFLLYSEDYKLTDTQNQFNKYKVNEKILDLLLVKGNIHLPDNQGNTPIFTLINTNYYPLLENMNSVNFENSFNKKMTLKQYLLSDITNHINQFVSDDSFLKSLNNFIEPFENDLDKTIKNERSTFKNNILFNLKTGLKICYFLILDQLNYVGNNDTDSKFTEYIFNTTNKLPKNDNFVIRKLIINDLQNRNRKLLKKIANLKDYQSDKKKKYHERMVKHDKIILSIASNIQDKTDIDSTGLGSRKGIEKYNYIIENRYGIGNLTAYIYAWDKFFSQNTPLENSFFEKFRDVKKQITSSNKIENDHLIKMKDISNYCRIYFEERKYYAYNSSLKFTYDLLIHLTQVIIGEGVEHLITKLFYEFVKNNLNNVSIKDTINIVEKIINRNYLWNGKELKFQNIVKEEMNKILVMNLANMYENLKQESSVQYESSQDIIEKVFNLIVEDNLIPIDTRYLKTAFEEDIIYFLDGTTKKCIKLWHSMVENIFRFMINHYRKINIYNELIDKI